jgi:hypothetical protein
MTFRSWWRWNHCIHLDVVIIIVCGTNDFKIIAILVAILHLSVDLVNTDIPAAWWKTILVRIMVAGK